MKTIRIIPLIILLANIVSAQPMQQDKKEKIESMKIGMITSKLNLTPEEAKIFWPVYDKYSDELEQLRKSRLKNLLNTKENFDEMSDADMEKAVDNEIIFRSGEVDILKKYHPQFKKILPIKKVAKLYKAEEDFKRKLVEMIRERKGDQRGPGQGPGPDDGDRPRN